jgi:uncharacterized protein
MARQVSFGTRKGQIYPHEEAGGLLRSARKLIQPPGRIARRLNLSPEAAVLELGCGPGYFSPEVAKRAPRGTYVLFDFQAQMLRMAASRLPDAGAAPHLVQGDALSLPFRSGTFDVVFLVAVLGETGDPTACLRQVHRILRPGGRLSISEIRGDDDFIPRKKLRAMARDAGFEHERSHGIGWNYTENFVAAAGAAS